MAKETVPDWLIQPLGRQHDRTAFTCGHVVLDDWLKLRAGQHDKKDLARTYVALRPTSEAVLGYYAISAHRVAYEILPEDQTKGLPRIEVPVLLLGRLAVHTSVQGQGLGALLLMDALRRAQFLAERVGIRAVEVDAIDDTARSFYQRFGFTPLVDNPRHLYLPMQLIRKLRLPFLD